MPMLTCGNYNEDFITCLLKEVDDKIALLSNKDYKNNIYNLGLCVHVSKYMKLIQFKEILEKVMNCNSCYDSLKIEDIVSQVKNELNKY